MEGWRKRLRHDSATEFKMEVDAESLARIEALQRAGGFKDFSTFLTDALIAFEWLMEESAHGRRIASIEADGSVSAELELRRPRDQQRGL
jgi:hypothetical protein